MWSSDSLGRATWCDAGSSWPIDARGGAAGISLWDHAEQSLVASLQPVDQPRLPGVAEQYVRGRVWHLNYPQGAGRYAMRLALRPIETTPQCLVLEIVVSIQTDLLDTHPMIDLDVTCESKETLFPSDPRGSLAETHGGAAPISIGIGRDVCCSVLLGPHDRPCTADHSTESRLRLRLFGEFLEKGVIRRGRPWLVIERGGAIPDRERLTTWFNQLSESPLPLT